MCHLVLRPCTNPYEIDEPAARSQVNRVKTILNLCSYLGLHLHGLHGGVLSAARSEVKTIYNLCTYLGLHLHGGILSPGLSTSFLKAGSDERRSRCRSRSRSRSHKAAYDLVKIKL